MKYFILYTAFIAMLINSCSNVFGNISRTNIYIENHYGAAIKFKIGANSSNAPEISVADQARVLVGSSSEVTNLSIRTTGTGSSYFSSFTELTPQLNQIKQNEGNEKNKDAIIIIKPSRSYQPWNIDIHWEQSGQGIEELSDVEARLIEIMHGALGQNYAEKARAINDYDYTKSTKRGQINLRKALLKYINETMVQTYQQSAGRKTAWIAPELSTTQELKDNIDMLSRALARYKAQDNQ